ncbi:MAG: sulfatase [Verrucomicrobia bacterium]|nr:sulfatase [Verrucomicrobiota bacterium]
MNRVLLLALLAGLASAAEPRLNILFLVVDDLRTDLGCYGDPLARTPHLDALAARGVRFTRAYSQQAVCNPSRASVLTGRRPDTLRVWDLQTHFRQNAPDVVTLPQHFKNHGYHTEAIGKIFHDPPKFRDAPSWSVPAQLDDTEGERGKYASAENLRIYQPDGKKGREKAAATDAADVPDHAYIDGRVADLAVTRVRALATQPQPFFLAIGFRRPHLPFSAPSRFWDQYDADKLQTVPQPQPPRGAPEVALHDSAELRGYTDMPKVGPLTPAQIKTLRHGYYAATSFSDAQIGRVLAALREAGAEKNTLIVLWSDHGYHLGEHGLWAKTTNYEVDTRVPLIVTRPGEPHPGAASPALTELLDLYPTLADLCGLPAPVGVEGRSLRPWLDDPARASRPAAFSQFPRPWTYRAEPGVMGYAVRTPTHRYIEWRNFATGEVTARELYAYRDDADLFETENLAGNPAEAARVRALSALLPRR